MQVRSHLKTGPRLLLWGHPSSPAESVSPDKPCMTVNFRLEISPSPWIAGSSAPNLPGSDKFLGDPCSADHECDGYGERRAKGPFDNLADSELNECQCDASGRFSAEAVSGCFTMMMVHQLCFNLLLNILTVTGLGVRVDAWSDSAQGVHLP